MADTIEVEVASELGIGVGEPLNEFLSRLDGWAAKVPAEWRHRAFVTLTGTEDGDSLAGIITLSYTRPLTSEESERRKTSAEDGERRELARLRAKYPD